MMEAPLKPWTLIFAVAGVIAFLFLWQDYGERGARIEELALDVPPDIADIGCGTLTDQAPDGLVPASVVPLWPATRE